jgi:hypothetical protein
MTGSRLSQPWPRFHALRSTTTSGRNMMEGILGCRNGSSAISTIYSHLTTMACGDAVVVGVSVEIGEISFYHVISKRFRK